MVTVGGKQAVSAHPRLSSNERFVQARIGPALWHSLPSTVRNPHVPSQPRPYASPALEANNQSTLTPLTSSLAHHPPATQRITMPMPILVLAQTRSSPCPCWSCGGADHRRDLDHRDASCAFRHDRDRPRRGLGACGCWRIGSASVTRAGISKGERKGLRSTVLTLASGLDG
jgi:hypothetical protein